MITAVDTNILLDVFGADARFGPLSAEAIRACLRDGSLLASDVVWAETAAVFRDPRRFEHAMSTLPVAFSAVTQAAALRAAIAWRRYRASGGPRLRIAADFLIGAHALTVADCLLTRDRGFYRRYFTGLRVIDPTSRN